MERRAWLHQGSFRFGVWELLTENMLLDGLGLEGLRVVEQDPSCVFWPESVRHDRSEGTLKVQHRC